MTDREKLVELISNFQHRYGNEILVVNGAELLADHLIANGVVISKSETTMQEWIPVTERLPEPPKEGNE